MNEISIKIGLWYDVHKRDLPWRHTRDAYLIWLSEVILQQTRVAQGYDYWVRFVKAFPSVEALANASEDSILKLWQGLGYYSRARNLHAAACQVVNDLKRHTFPTSYEELIKLKGVGPYTAAAVASLSSDEEVAVVDGNVYRVLARLFDISTPIDSTTGHKEFQQLANQMLITPSSHHNQAIMEFGALQCTPSAPDCNNCLLSGHCLSLANDTVDQRPVKQGKTKVRDRYLSYIIYIYKDTLWVHQRKEGDIWQGLWEFVLDEELGSLPADKQNWGDLDAGCEKVLILQKKHQLSHQTLHADFWVVKLPNEETPANNKSIQSLPEDYRQVTWMEWQQLAVPRLIDEANKQLSAWF